MRLHKTKNARPARPGNAESSSMTSRSKLIGALIAGSVLASAPMAHAALTGPVKTGDGLVKGVQAKAPGVTVWKGIPFGKAPVGNLRWKAPQPVKAWKGVKVASKFGDVCLQPHGKGRPNITVDEPDSPAMSEDCLYLNVWSGAKKAGEKRPVMVWIYGGAYTEGGGSTIAYDGTNLAKKGAVVVTFNYRLGTLGFLSHPELTAESGHNASGNYALMDAITTLKWIRRNIAQFGGDPNSVTIMGQSAGACMVAALAGSPESKGLFQRAVSESGAWSGLSVAKMQTLESAEKATVAAGEKIGAHSLADLRKLSGDDALTKLGRANMIVDGLVIPEDLTKTFAEGRQNKVDVLTGNNGNEGGFGGGFGGRGPAVTAATWKSGAEQRWGSAAALGLAAYPGATDEEAKADAGKPFTDNMAFLQHLFASSAEKVGRRGWLYQFTHNPPYPDGKPANGPTHATEVAYVFNNLEKPHLFPDGADPAKASKNPADIALADQMSSYWVNFARTGNPNGKGLPKWPEANELPPGEAMLLDDPSHPGVALTAEKLALYQALYDRDFGSK
jgi:para-nitrobenzyl esterase